MKKRYCGCRLCDGSIGKRLKEESNTRFEAKIVDDEIAFSSDKLRQRDEEYTMQWFDVWHNMEYD